MRVAAVSSVYETEPMYVEDQAWFLNCVAVVETDLPPRRLLALLKATERRLGRGGGMARNGPREIDIDILLYGDAAVSEPSLVVPHPRMGERAFVLVPLREVRPDLVIPGLGKTAAELLRGLEGDKAVVRVPGALADVAPPRPRRSGRRGGSPSRRGS